MQCVILAGGLGTRMRQITGDTPKTLLPVNGFPFAFYQLAWLARHGISDVVYSIGFQGHLIQQYVADGSRWDLRVSYVADGTDLCGTAGALRRVFDAGLLRGWFFVLYGDSFLPFDLRRLASAFLAQARPAMMTVYRNEGRFDSSNVHFADGVVRTYRKASAGEPPLPGMDFIDYGVTALRPELVAGHIPPGRKIDLSVTYHDLSSRGLLAGLEVNERFYEIGSPDGLRDFEAWTVFHPAQSWAKQ
jgi:NDP-sugar pyrophosphorylase family protein